ncbi:MAG: TetR/AcrR family transcriptional regulator [Brevundimonas sp.]|uniref:TetR/AcrR family transcriptional regulator n=1 Tax=Brevundimonas sp. TaxID=1871086 RepID=UPI0027349539|nr:TetR/AcrR family transcriptional regulator [Brevundimonas sp.]MDP3405076.1 TetR/AcrR family transcriptional regulator [Brevundimonas sp.]
MTAPAPNVVPFRASRRIPATRSPRLLAKAETRRKVMDAARFLFLNVGYFDTGMRAVARRAGMSTGAVFNTVTDKQQLWREACGGPPPSELLAEEVAMILAAWPGFRWNLHGLASGDCLASIMTPDYSPLDPLGRGRIYHGKGDSPGSAVREARIAAERELGANGVRRWTEAGA